MAPAHMHTSSVILPEVVIARVSVRALIDSGATTSCYSRQWYQKYHVEIGSLMHDQTQVIGVENTPIFVVPTLIEPDVILGIYLLQRLGVSFLCTVFRNLEDSC